MDPKKQAVILFVLMISLPLLFVCAGAFQAASAEDPTGLPVPGLEIGLPDAVLIMPEGETGPVQEDPAEDTLCLAEETAPEIQNCGTDEVLSLSGEQDAAAFGTDSERVEEALMDYSLADLDGEEIRLGDLILGNQVTMLNIWGISCAPCLLEIPNLVDLREEFKDRGFEIIGLASDLLDWNGETDPDLLEEARELVTELDVSYPILVLTGEIRKQMQIIATPTTIFVNSKGQVIGDVIMGTRSKNEWDRMIRDILEQPENG